MMLLENEYTEIYLISQRYLFLASCQHSPSFFSAFMYLECESNKLSGSVLSTIRLQHFFLEHHLYLLHKHRHTYTNIQHCALTMIATKMGVSWHLIKTNMLHITACHQEVHKSRQMDKVNLKQRHGTKEFVQFPSMRQRYSCMLGQSFWNQFIFWNKL